MEIIFSDYLIPCWVVRVVRHIKKPAYSCAKMRKVYLNVGG